MTKRFYFFLVLLAAMSTGIIGCQDSPLSIISPTSDIHIVGVDRSVLLPKAKEDSDTGALTITLPMLITYFQITNGVSAFLHQYSIRFYQVNGASLANGRFDFAGGVSLYVAAPDVVKSTSGSGSGGAAAGANIRAQAGEGTSSQTVPENSGFISIEAYAPKVYSYISRNTVTLTDDLTPVIARISFLGRDINDHEVNLSTQVTLTTVPEDSGAASVR